jgi:hypothetical protein
MINPILTSSILALALLRTTTAFIPASSTCRHATTTTTTAPRAISTVLRNSSKPTTTNSPGIGKAADISSLTVPQLKTLLRENGLKLSGNKAELVSRLSTMAQESKQAKLSELSSVAMKMKEKKKQTPNQGKAPPGLKKQVAVEVESRKASASANAKTKASVNANTDKAASASAKANRVNGFSAIGVPQNLVARLDAMGIYDPTPIQKEAIPLAIKGRDVMGLAQTGTGKTLAFGLPLVAQMMEDTNTNTKTNIKDKGYNGKTRNKSVKGLVLAPTRELANQIAVQLGTLTQHTPIRTFVVVGGQSINTQSNKLKLGTELLVATPGRLIDLVERGALSLQGATFLVLDEADLMLDMGFAPSLRKIATMLPKKRQTMLFSATMKKEMNVVASSYLKDPVRVEVARAGKTADKIMQEVHFIDRLDKTRKLLDMLGHPDHRDDRAIVFGRTKHGMEKLSKTLLAAGIKAGSIHGKFKLMVDKMSDGIIMDACVTGRISRELIID